MKIALIGYGKMGRAIGEIAVRRGHEIVAAIDVNNMEEFDKDAFRTADVAIEFTTPATAFGNYQKCFAAGIPVVSGTTGWTDRLGEIRKQCDEEGNTFFYASNFSIGVNIFFALNKYLASVMNGFPQYDVSMTEVHHIHKLDAPSGTAITLAEGLIENIDRKTSWAFAGQKEGDCFVPRNDGGDGYDVVGDGKDSNDGVGDGAVYITAVREGEVPGIHEIRYESEVDSITIKHDAKSRAGFALGAVLAAEFTAGKKGFLTMNDMLKI